MTQPVTVLEGGHVRETEVGLRAYFERMLVEADRLRQTELSGLRSEMVARLDASDKALVIQLTAAEKALLLKSAEMERRLEMLNGEAGRLAKVLNESVPREVWSESQKSLDVWKSGVDKQLTLTAGRDRGIGLSWGVILGAIGAAGGIVSLVLILTK